MVMFVEPISEVESIDLSRKGKDPHHKFRGKWSDLPDFIPPNVDRGFFIFSDSREVVDVSFEVSEPVTKNPDAETEFLQLQNDNSSESTTQDSSNPTTEVGGDSPTESPFFKAFSTTLMPSTTFLSYFDLKIPKK